MKMHGRHLKVSRILAEDEDFLTLEVGKRDDVTFHLQQNDDGETVGGDRFLTVLFVRSDGKGGMEAWDPTA